MPSFKLPSIAEVNQALNPKNNAAGAVTGTAIDGTGFDRAMFILCVGDISTGGGMKASIKQASTQGATYTAISSATCTLLTAAGTDDNKCVIIDVPIASATPWVKLTGTASTAHVWAAGACVLYNGNGRRPPTQGSDETVIA